MLKMCLRCLTLNIEFKLHSRQKVNAEMLSMMAEFIVNRKLDEINKQNMPCMIALAREDRDKLIEIMKEKMTLLNQAETLQESAKTNRSSTLSQGLNNLESKLEIPLPTSPKLRTQLNQDKQAENYSNQSGNNLGSELKTLPKSSTLLKQTNRPSKNSDEFLDEE